jgi:hypothetical protein
MNTVCCAAAQMRSSSSWIVPRVSASSAPKGSVGVAGHRRLLDFGGVGAGGMPGSLQSPCHLPVAALQPGRAPRARRHGAH